jgi:6-phosphogluconolactonase (cycloisomerase 2 family)
METVKLSCKIGVNVPSKPLDFKVLIDEEVVYEIDTDQSEYIFSHNIETSDDNLEHSVKFIIDGKTDNHTVIDSSGEIVESAQIEITDINLEDIDITEIFLSNDDLMTYTHNNNGYSKDEITEAFSTFAGYNGTIEFKFSTPVYLWLLENM